MANLTSPLIQQTQESLQVIENSKSWLKKDYDIKELIGWGSNGVVVMAIDKKTKKYVALKIVQPKPQSSTRFV